MSEKTKITCGCYIPLLLIAFGIFCGAVFELQLNSMQFASCAEPSELFMNAEACREVVEQSRNLYGWIGAFFGGFGGFILGLALTSIVAMRSPKNTETMNKMFDERLTQQAAQTSETGDPEKKE